MTETTGVPMALAAYSWLVPMIWWFRLLKNVLDELPCAPVALSAELFFCTWRQCHFQPQP
jgi:hypothetical protein